MMQAKIVLIVDLDGINCDLELLQIDEDKVSLAVYRDSEVHGLRRESAFVCDRVELINALQKLPKVQKLINE